MKKSRFIVPALSAAILSAILFTSCSSSTAAVASGTSNSSSSKASASSKIYNVGETLKVDNIEMTVTKVDKSQGSEYDKPQKAENEFVIVSVSIKNDGQKQVSYNPYYFKMQNSQGQIVNTTYTSINSDTSLNSGDLAAGGSVTGTVAFEEPTNDAGLVLQYQDNVFANGSKLQFKIS